MAESAADVLRIAARFVEAFQHANTNVAEFDRAVLALAALEPERVRQLAAELDDRYRGPEGQGEEQ